MAESRVPLAESHSLTNEFVAILKELSVDENVYPHLYTEYSQDLKLAVLVEYNNNKEVVDLLRFRTSASGERFSSLEEYVARMKENQKNIYFISGGTEVEVASSCYIEKLNKLGFEVIYMTDAPYDELVVQTVKDYDGKKLVSASEEDIELPEDKEEKSGADKVELEFLCRAMQETLADKVIKVVVSRRLVDSVACIIPPARNCPIPASPNKILEINPEHAFVIHAKVKAEAQEFDRDFKIYVDMIFREGLHLSGFNPQDEVEESDQNTPIPMEVD